MKFLHDALAQRGLIVSMAQREIASRYQGTAMGWVWALAQPLVTLAVYTLVFGVILKVHWAQRDSTGSFALVLFSGLMVFNFVAEVLTRAPSAISSYPNYVKKVVFPLEVLIWQIVGAAAFQLVLNFVIWMGFYVLLARQLHLSWLWLPMLLVPLACFVLGLGLALATLGVFVRDLAQAMGPVMVVLLYLSPVFYSASMVPTELANVMGWNPLAMMIEPWRAAMFGEPMPWLDVLKFCAWALATLAAGAWLFERTRPGFADVL